MNEVDALRSALSRERAARREAEELLEAKSTELFRANRELETARSRLEQRVADADAEIARSLRRLQLVLRASKAGSLEWHPAADRIFVNETLAELVERPGGATSFTLEGWLERVATAHRPLVRDALVSTRSGSGVECDFAVVDSDRVLHLIGRALGDDRDAQPIVFALVRDVTATRRTQQDQRRIADSRSRRERLSVLGELASAIAHEVNQPLGSLCNYAAAARIRLDAFPDADPDLRRMVDEMGTLARRATETIRALRSTLAEPGADFETAETADIVSGGIMANRQNALDAGIEIRAAPGASWPLRCNPVLLEHALSNLIRNAIEAIESGAQAGVVDVHVFRAGGSVVFRVDDNGPGRVDLLPDNIFDALVTSKPGGSGMGLALCRTAAEQHGGVVRCRPNPDHPTGLRFELEIPMEGPCSPPSMS